jgi:hypothetical protein
LLSHYYEYRVKKIASIASFLSGFPILLAAAGPAYAQDLCASAGSNFSSLCKLRIETNTGGIVGTIVQVLLLIAVIASLFFLILGGIRWITSGGDKSKIASARSTLIAAVVGLVISLAAFFILDFFVTFFTGQSFINLKIPRLID